MGVLGNGQPSYPYAMIQRPRGTVALLPSTNDFISNDALLISASMKKRVYMARHPNLGWARREFSYMAMPLQRYGVPSKTTKSQPNSIHLKEEHGFHWRPVSIRYLKEGNFFRRI